MYCARSKAKLLNLHAKDVQMNARSATLAWYSFQRVYVCVTVRVCGVRVFVQISESTLLDAEMNVCVCAREILFYVCVCVCHC